MLTIEKKQYEEFQRRFKNGDYGTMRYGQAMHNHFSLEKVVNPTLKSDADKLYRLDGSEAKHHIKNMFIFN